MLRKITKGALSMKKALFPEIFLCSVMMTGCFYDTDVMPETGAVHPETMPETTAFIEAITTEGISDEATETSSEMVPAETVMTETTEFIPPTEMTETTTFIVTESVTTIIETTEIITPAEPTTPAETEQLTEPETTIESVIESTEPEQSDYGKALEVYEYMLENGHGTCVNYSCQTYEKCQEIGLPCYIVWTDAQLYGHGANTVQVEGIWFILDTQGQKFLTYNIGFTEVIDMEMNHIGDADMLSPYRYDELYN